MYDRVIKQYEGVMRMMMMMSVGCPGTEMYDRVIKQYEGVGLCWAR
jgi:hypothetical protein